MEFLTEDFAKENNLTPEAVQAITSAGSEYIAGLKKGWDGKASQDADAILDGAFSAIEKETGISREKGEHANKFIPRVWESYNANKLSDLQSKLKEANDKLKAQPGNEAFKKQIEELENKIDNHYQPIEAKYLKLEEAKYEERFPELESENNRLKEQIALIANKPQFPDTLNKFEAEAVWGAFVQKFKENYELIEDPQNPGKWLGISKKNSHLKYSVEELIKKDEEIQKRLEGRQIRSPHSDPKNETRQIEGLPFKVPVEADSSSLTEAITEHLATQKDSTGNAITQMHPEFSQRFTKLMADYHKKKSA